MLVLQQLGERLTTLSSRELSRLPMSDALREAVEESRRIKSLNALRRHYRRLGKLLRREDLDSIQQVISDLDDHHKAGVDRFHALERWRERLLAEERDAFGDFLQAYPSADRQQLRQLVLAARREQEQDRPPVAYRKLFKFLREVAGI